MTTTIFLPQVTADFSRELPEETLLLVLGGRPPALPWLENLLAVQEQPPAVWAVDHGVDACRAANLPPALLLGDADSASTAGWGWGKQTAATTERHPVEKDLTDTQLALALAANQDAVLLLTGAFGGRFDHAFSTVFSAAHDAHTVVLADEREVLFFVRAGERLTLDFRQSPRAISTLPLSEIVRGVTLTGTRWPLQDATLRETLPSAVSNRLADGKTSCAVSVAEGILGVTLVFAE